jgi:hypothetical protein
MQNGLPFFNSLTDFASGTNARAFAPAKANLNRGLQQAHASPMARLQANTDFDMQRARGFDSALTSNLFANEQAKQQGAQILSGQANQLNPLGYYQAAGQGFNPQMYSGLRSPGMGGLDRRACEGGLSGSSSILGDHSMGKSSAATGADGKKSDMGVRNSEHFAKMC